MQVRNITFVSACEDRLQLQERLRLQHPYPRVLSLSLQQLVVGPGFDNDRVVHIPNRDCQARDGPRPCSKGHSQDKIGVSGQVPEPVRREHHRLVPPQLAQARKQI